MVDKPQSEEKQPRPLILTSFNFKVNMTKNSNNEINRMLETKFRCIFYHAKPSNQKIN